MIDSWKVLVMDESSTKIISSALTMYDIMEHRVTLVEQLTKNRQPFPEMDVIYFVAPTRESVKLICDDFSSSGKPKYGNVHLFFSDTVRISFLENSNILYCSRYLHRLQIIDPIWLHVHVLDNTESNGETSSQRCTRKQNQNTARDQYRLLGS